MRLVLALVLQNMPAVGVVMLRARMPVAKNSNRLGVTKAKKK